MSERRDTPVDVPAVLSRRVPIDDQLEVIRSVDALEPAFEAWAEFRAAHALRLQALLGEERQLDEQGALLLGAARRTGPGTEGLAVTPLLAKAREALEVSRRAVVERFAAASAEIISVLRERVERHAHAAPPLVTLMVRVLPGDERILHLARPKGDDAVLLLHAIAARIPTRYGFLFDDSTDDSNLPPPALYGAEDLGAPELQLLTRPSPAELREVLERLTEVWPVKGMLPVLAPSLVRWLSRGAVLEAEIADGQGFRNRLTRDEAEEITARLLSLKLEGKIEFELGRG